MSTGSLRISASPQPLCHLDFWHTCVVGIDAASLSRILLNGTAS
jgi:hypothetical protein